MLSTMISLKYTNECPIPKLVSGLFQHETCWLITDSSIPSEDKSTTPMLALTPFLDSTGDYRYTVSSMCYVVNQHFFTTKSTTKVTRTDWNQKKCLWTTRIH